MLHHGIQNGFTVSKSRRYGSMPMSFKLRSLKFSSAAPRTCRFQRPRQTAMKSEKRESRSAKMVMAHLHLSHWLDNRRRNAPRAVTEGTVKSCASRAQKSQPISRLGLNCSEDGSVDLRARSFDDRRPFGEFGFDEFAGGLGRAAGRCIDPGFLQRRDHRRIGERFVDRGIELLDDRLWRAG